MTREVILTAGQPQEFYEVGDFLRILSAAGPLTIEFYNKGREVSEAVNVSKGYAEKFDRGTFDRVRLVSATTQPVQFVTRLGNVVLYDAAPIGDTAIVSSVPIALDAATLLEEKRPALPGLQSTQNAALVASTAVNIFTAASNVNGAVIWTAAGTDKFASDGALVLIAKATVPASITDGEMIQAAEIAAVAGATYHSLSLQRACRIGAGLGLWWIGTAASSVPSMVSRSVQYTLL